MIGCSEAILDQSLVDYVDSLDGQTIRGIRESEMVDFRLTYGSDGPEDMLLEKLDAELHNSTEAYITELEKFLSISPDYGMLSFAIRRGFSSYSGPPPHTSHGRDLEQWLEVAKKHLPGAEQEVMDEIVACIADPNLYNPLNYERAITEISADPGYGATEFARDAIAKAGQNLAKTTTEQLCDYATNVETIQQFIDSSFMQTYGDEAQRTALHLRMLALRGEQLRPDQYSLAASMIDRSSSSDFKRNLGQILEYEPDIVAGIVAENPQQFIMAPILGRTVLGLITSERKAEKYEVIITQVEKGVSDDLKAYGRFIEGYLDETGVFELKHIRRLRELVETAEVVQPNSYEAQRRLDVLCANLPIDELNDFADKYPGLVRSYAAHDVCVRRFAADGQKERAFELARSCKRVEGYWDVLSMAHRLLSIYDETGDESAYNEAEQLVQSVDMDSVQHKEKEMHKVLVHMFTAARRHGHTERAEQARVLMEPYYDPSLKTDIQHECLEQRVHIALDDGDFKGAEHFAGLLYNSTYSSSGIDADKYRSGALLHTLQAYVKANDIDNATNLVKTYFATDKPHAMLKQALAILKKEPYDQLTSLFGERVNAIKAVMDPRGTLI